MNIDKDKQTIKNTIYTENGEKMFYIDLDSREAENFIKAIENVLSELEKKDNIIDLMSRAISNYDSQLVINQFKDKEEVKKYFEENYEELMKKYDR